ncbi:hypothetical protein RB653_004118 [Dictyostelium firmibasis]|uniref:MHD2 domain-containing protein n=1 Tax=Dictyostelium firmibasis TaxID=79012 RepID=A0AAN7U5N6_9MYCE
MEEVIKHKAIISNNEAYAIIRAILCLYSVNKTEEFKNSANEKTMGPVLKKAFGLSDEQYNEISEKILEYTTEEITISELQLRYAWKDNHPIYKSKAFKDPDGHTKWQKKEFQDIKKLLKDPSLLDLNTKLQLNNNNNNNNINININNKNKNENLKPSIQDVFNITLKKHTIEKSNGGKDNIHIGYKILVNAFLQYSSQEVYREDRQHPIKSSLLKSNDLFNLGLLPEFTWILNEYSILYGIRDFYRYLVIFDVLTTRFDDSLNQLNLLSNCFDKLQSIRKSQDNFNETITTTSINGNAISGGINFNNNDNSSGGIIIIITEDEDELFNKISSNLFNNLLIRIGNYRICFTPNQVEKLPQRQSQPYQRLIKTVPLTFALNLMKHIVNELFSDLIDFQSVIKKAIIEANEKEYIRSMEHFEALYNGQINSNYQQIFLLSKVINDIIDKWFDWEIYYFDLSFSELLKSNQNQNQNQNINQNQKQIHLEIVFQTFSNFINKSVNNIYRHYSNEEHTVRNNKSGKLEAAPWITCLFSDLIPSLVRYNEIVFGLFKKKPIALEGEISFLTGQFILNRISILNTNIKYLIKHQEWKPNGKGVFHTSCPIDFFEFLTQCYSGIQTLEIKLSIPSNPMTRSFGTNLGDTFLFFVKGIRSMILNDLPLEQQKSISNVIDNAISNQATPKQLFQSLVENVRLPKLHCYNITEKMCLQINDIEQSRGLLQDFDDKYNNIFRNSLNELFTTLKDHWNYLLTYYVYKMNCYIKPIIQSISLSYNDNSTTNYTKELANFIEVNLSFCNKKLQANLFPILLKRLFQSIVNNMLDIILPNKKIYNKLVVEKSLSNFKGLMDELTKVFHGEGDKTSTYFELTLDDYTRIKKVIELYTFDSQQLIEFHKILLRSHSKSVITANEVSNSNNLLDESFTIMNFKRNDSKEIENYLKNLNK